MESDYIIINMALMLCQFVRIVDSKIEARNLLANMLGFTRHERLDVKKPGPPPSPPEQPVEDSSANSHLPASPPPPEPKIDVTKEVLPAHIKDNPLPKLKKDFHNDDDHAPHSVDTDYTYVYLKPAYVFINVFIISRRRQNRYDILRVFFSEWTAGAKEHAF